MTKNDDETATSIRYREMQAELRARMFAHDPLYLLESVARHYSSLAMMAMSLRKMIESRRRAPADYKPAGIDQAIEYAFKQIVEAHVQEFGVLPSWEIMRRKASPTCDTSRT